MTFAEAAMIMMSGTPSAIDPITITENGHYEAPEGVNGYNPIDVNVQKKIKSITITRNGTYNAPAGVDGYNPVIVNNPYETLWKQEHGLTEKIDTEFTDPEGAPITIDGLPVGNIDDLVNSEFIPGQPIDTTFAALSDSGMIYVHLQYNETVIKPDWEIQYYLSLTVTNAQTGESKTKSNTMSGFGGQYPVVTLNTMYGIEYSCVLYGGYPIGIHLKISPADVGVTGSFRYYVCKPEG